MTGMPALSLHQPPASLCVTRQPLPPPDPHLDGNAIGAFANWPMVKRFETRSWACPPNLIGSRIALHATKKAERCFVAGDVVMFAQPPGLVLPD